MFGNNAFGTTPFGLAQPELAIRLQASATLAVNFDYKIYAATAEFITVAADTPANQPFSGTLDQPITFKRSILGGDAIGTFLTGSGELTILNPNGFYDFLPQQYALDGRPIEIRYGRLSDQFSSWLRIFNGTASDFSVAEDLVTVELVDNAYKMNVPLQVNTYGGTGGIEGGGDLAGKRKPRAFGYVLNVEPPLVIPNALLYQVNDGPVQAISAVYVKGSALTLDRDYATSTDLRAATIASGFYATCLAEGMFRINFLLDPPVTADVEGDSSGTGFVATAAGMVRRIVTLATALSDPDDLYLPSFAAMDIAQPAPLGYWADHNDTSTVNDVFARLLESIGGWAGFRRDGKLEVAKFTTPASPPVLRIDRSYIRDLKREKLPSGVTPTPWRWTVGYQRNWTVQTTDVAGSVSDTRKAFLAEQYRIAEAKSAAVQVDHPFAQEHPLIEAYFRDQADAQAHADELLALWRSSRALYRIVTDPTPLRINIGEVVEVTFPRFDLTQGRLLRVVEITEDGKQDRVEIVGFG